MDPCAVIITICGRSPSGIDADSSRTSSRPVMPGIRLSTTNRSNGRSASWRCASRALDGLDHVVALVAKRAAEPLEDLLFVVGEQDRAAGTGSCRASAASQRAASMRSRCPRPAGSCTEMVPPRPSMMFLAIGRPSPVPARRVVKYGSKMWARSLGRDADAAVA